MNSKCYLFGYNNNDELTIKEVYIYSWYVILTERSKIISKMPTCCKSNYFLHAEFADTDFKMSVFYVFL